MKRLYPFAVALAALGFLSVQVHAQEKADAKALIGTYQIAAGQVGDRKIPGAEITDNTVQIGADTILVFDKDRKQLYKATYQLDTSKTPWVIHMTATVAREKGAKSQGLVAMEDDMVKLIYALPDGKAPDDFKPKDKQQLFILKKSK